MQFDCLAVPCEFHISKFYVSKLMFFLKLFFQTYTQGPRNSTMPSANQNAGTPQQPSTPNSQCEEKLSQTNLYIRGLKPETTDKDLINLCRQYVAFYWFFTPTSKTFGGNDGSNFNFP